MIQTDILIIGAGAAGASLAHSLSRLPLSTTIVDPRFACRPSFKAEKLEPDQSTLLESLGLLGAVESICAPIEGVSEFRSGRLVRHVPTHQYGMRYENFVNCLIDSLPSVVQKITSEAVGIQHGEEGNLVRLRDGTLILARLIVLASGVAQQLRVAAGLGRVTIREDQSVVFGFDLTSENSALETSSINFAPREGELEVGFLTTFPVPGAIRANLFTYCSPKGSMVRQFIDSPEAMLLSIFPGINRVLGDFGVSGKVSAAAIALWASTRPAVGSVVAIGDACQSVCPATGTGISKVLTDASVLADVVASVLAPAGLNPAEVCRRYYEDARKRTVDARSIKSATDLRDLATRPGIAGLLRRRGWNKRWLLDLIGVPVGGRME